MISTHKIRNKRLVCRLHQLLVGESTTTSAHDMTGGPNQINGLNYYERSRLKSEMYFKEERAKIDRHFGQPIIIDLDEGVEGK